MDNTKAATNMPTTARPTAVVCASNASESATSGPATRGGRNGATSPKPTMLPMASDAAADAAVSNAPKSSAPAASVVALGEREQDEEPVARIH